MLSLSSLNRLLLVGLLVGLISSLFAANSNGKQVIEVASGDNVSLLGTITVASAFGPPNFGETPEQDRKETYFVLSTLCPIRMRDSDGSQLPDTEKVQLILPGDKSELHAKIKEAIGHAKIKVSGKAYPATTGHHHESIILVLGTVESSNARPEPPK